MKKRRRIEVIHYSSLVKTVDGSDSVERDAGTVVPSLTDIIANERQDRSSADELGSLATTVNANEDKRARGRVGRLRSLFRPRRRDLS